MTDFEIRAWLVARAGAQLAHHGHTVSGINWDSDGQEAKGTCSRCGDGVVVYFDPEPESCTIEGTAYNSSCPGGSCEHGWRLVQRASSVKMQCAHCGAEMSAAGHLEGMAPG